MYAKKEPVDYFGKHEAVRDQTSCFESGHTLPLPISDSKAEVV